MNAIKGKGHYGCCDSIDSIQETILNKNSKLQKSNIEKSVLTRLREKQYSSKTRLQISILHTTGTATTKHILSSGISSSNIEIWGCFHDKNKHTTDNRDDGDEDDGNDDDGDDNDGDDYDGDDDDGDSDDNDDDDDVDDAMDPLDTWRPPVAATQ